MRRVLIYPGTQGTKKMMFPRSLAVIDSDAGFSQQVAQYLRDVGMRVERFGHAQALFEASNPYGFDFYVLDLVLPGMDGLELIAQLRLRCQAGLLVVTGRVANNVFKNVVDAGADMYLPKPVQVDQVAIAVRAVYRRSDTARHRGATASAWILDRGAGQLVAPDGARVDLSDGDLKVMECFIDARGEPVPREVLRARLGRPKHTEIDDGLNATIYRLRRRIERATPMLVPLQSRSRVGYVFRAPLNLG